MRSGSGGEEGMEVRDFQIGGNGVAEAAICCLWNDEFLISTLNTFAKDGDWDVLKNVSVANFMIPLNFETETCRLARLDISNLILISFFPSFFRFFVSVKKDFYSVYCFRNSKRIRLENWYTYMAINVSNIYEDVWITIQEMTGNMIYFGSNPFPRQSFAVFRIF